MKMMPNFQDIFYQERIFETKQFNNWIEQIFEIKLKLEKTHDEIYQETFYVKIYDFITVGKEFLENIISKIEANHNLDPNNNIYNTNKLLLLIINEINNQFTPIELEFIEFRRHNSSHIFTKGYNLIKDDLKVKEKFKNKKLEDIHSNFDSIFLKHKSNPDFDKYFNKIVFNALNKIQII